MCCVCGLSVQDNLRWGEVRCSSFYFTVSALEQFAPSVMFEAQPHRDCGCNSDLSCFRKIIELSYLQGR